MKFDILIIQALLVSILTYVSEHKLIWEIALRVLAVAIALHVVVAITQWWGKRKGIR